MIRSVDWFQRLVHTGVHFFGEIPHNFCFSTVVMIAVFLTKICSVMQTSSSSSSSSSSFNFFIGEVERAVLNPRY